MSNKSALHKVQALLVITGLFVGFITVTHFRSVPARSYDADNTAERKYILETLLNEQSMLKNRIVSLREAIDEKQEQLKIYGEQENVDALEKMKSDIGLTELNGEGLEIIFDDSPNVRREGVDVNNEALVHAADLRDIINILRISKAKAISINDQRIVSSTAVSCVGNSILVNNTHTSPPFKIKAITDYEVTKNNIISTDYIGKMHDRIEKNSIVFEIHPQEQITIPVYNGDLKSKYIL